VQTSNHVRHRSRSLRAASVARRCLIGPLLTLSAEATLAFQRYRFSNGAVLGTTLFVVAYYQDAARRIGMRPSRMQVSLIGAITATLAIIAQRALLGFLHC
jgi:hypothetical protein